MRILSLAALFVSAWLSTCPLALGGLVISVDSTTLAEGGSKSLDVWIESDTVGGDPLSSAFFVFEISSGLRRLEFVDPQPDAQLGLGNYVFAGDSFDADNALAVGVVSTNIVPNDTFTGGDNTSSGTDVLITTPRLLARLQLTALTALAPQAGDTFTISLNTAGSSFDNTGGLSVFLAQPGVVTIVAPSGTIPEPSSWVLALTSAIGLWGLQRRSHG